MPAISNPDTLRILVATDSHVGYNERDPIRGDDSWKSFHEAMCLAKEEDVDMVLLGGDLFHENKPSRKSMYQVMRSLRINCLGDKPCELEMLSDSSEVFQGAFNHVNYEDPDINVSIPVFSIHGNHDDPSGEGHLCALDILQVSGLLNYYGRTPESDKIDVKPVLLQKGTTKLALFGISNVRDERLFRTFRDGGVKFFRPNAQKEDWFNLIAVHQNHHAHTETGFLPENFLPDFLDIVVWGHEHECLIHPKLNPETNFHVMQPGSSVATSLVPGEAEPKHVAVLSVTGRQFKVETHRLKTVRPFATKEIILNDEKGMKALAKRDNNRSELTRYLEAIVNEMIEDANAGWLEAQGENEMDEGLEVPLPLIRLKVEYSSPDGGRFECENPQRFSNRFVGKVANVNDVVYFWRKKISQITSKKAGELPEDSVIAQLAIDNVKVEKLVREFLTAQSLTILPQNSFGDAVSQFVDKDDKHAMEMFVNESLSSQIKHLMGIDDSEDEQISGAMDECRSKLEELFAAGALKRVKKARLKPKPDGWDTDMDGEWEDQPGALEHSDGGEDADNGPANAASKPKGRATANARTAKPPAKQAPKKTTTARNPTKRAPAKTKRAQAEDDEHDEHDDVIMLDDDVAEEDELSEEEPPPPPPAPKRGAAKKSAPTSTSASSRAPPASSVRSRKSAASPVPSSVTLTSSSMRRNAPRAAAATRQSTLDFSQNAKGMPSDDEISSDDEDAFEPAPSSTTARGGRRR